MAFRWGMLAATLLLGWSAGCGPATMRHVDPARQRGDENDGRSRGELILVRSEPGEQPPDLSAPSETCLARPEVLPETIELARRYTVAIRAPQSAARSSRTTSASASAWATDASSQSWSRGTGMIIDREGHILTNEHVIRGTDNIEVDLPGIGWIPARVVGIDPQSDLAVIGVDQPVSVTCRFGDRATIAVGLPVAAIGARLSASNEGETAGLVGRLSRLDCCLQSVLDPAQERFYGNMLESTVSLPPGYSGGPLIDACGRVIGVSTAAATDRHTEDRLGYAIPMSTYNRSIIARLARGERVEHGYLGVFVRTQVDGSSRAAMTTNADIVVERVVAGSPAARAGLRPGDVIAGVGGTPVRSASHLAERVRRAPVGSHISIHVERGARRLTLEATPTARVTRPSRH